MEIVVATNNMGKLKERKEIFKEESIYSLKEKNEKSSRKIALKLIKKTKEAREN